MKKVLFAAFIFVCAFAFVTWMSGTPTADARSTYYTDQGCQSCHGSNSTCNGCHSHGTHSSSGKTDVNIKGATSKTTYAPGEMVSVTITGGYKTGWVRAILYDQTMKQVAISKGTIASGASAPSGGPGFPITLSAPAPATAGTYTWNVSWYGNKYDATGAYFQTACSSTVTTNCWKASTNANHGEAIVATNSFTVSGGTTAYTLTVASSNPTSGVAITVSPADKNGATNGTTQFTRTYNGGTSVTLGAPASSTGGTFSKWQKDGVDYATTASTSVTIGANTTMTAVFGGTAEACQDGIDNNLNGLIDCADPACATDASCTGAANSAHAGINAYNGPTTCIACHTTAGNEVLNSMHGSWTGPTPNVTNISGDSGKWKQTNNYCTDPELADYGCVKCHVTTAAKVLNKDGMVDLSPRNLSANEMDCLQCHQAKYFATFIPNSTSTSHTSCVDGSVRTYQIPLPEADGKIHKQMRLDLAPGETALSLVRTVTRPNNATCVTKCHAKAGGSDGAKRGDMASNMADPPTTVDIHLSSAGTAKLTCTSCHAGTKHQIPGRGNDMRGEDTGAVMKKCVDCHTAMAGTSGHGTSTTNRAAADRHLAKVDCTSCHIDSYGKGISTEMNRDWTRPVWNPAGCEGQGAWVGEEVRASNVIPEYRFWNKTSWVYDRNGKAGLTTDLIDGGLAMSYPLGSMADGKLYPFKVHTSNNPIDDSSGKTNFDVLSMFMDGCFDKAAISGLAFIREAGAYTWKQNKAFQLITHGIVAKTEGDNCSKCHVTNFDTSVVSKLDKLGYKTPKPTSDLCNDCHSLQTTTSFISVHDTHRNRGINCSSCHSFSRP